MSENDLIERRAKLLANVVLTRRLNIDVFSIGTKDLSGLDLLCALHDDRVPGFLPFGVILKATSRPLDSSGDAASLVGKRTLFPNHTILMPVIALFFSMEKDEAYFAWIVEPSESSIRLRHVSKPEFTEFDNRQLDRMIKRIADWYRFTSDSILIEGAETVRKNGTAKRVPVG